MTGCTMLTFYMLTVILINTIQCDSEVTKLKIYKCCDFGQYVGVAKNIDGSRNRKQCMNGTYDIDDMMVYVNDLYTTRIGKNLSSSFDVIPRKFYVDKIFHKQAINSLTMQQFNYHVTENANLYLEMPNAYVRWTKIENTQFCVDYHKNKNVSIQFWMNFPPNPMDHRTYDYMTAAIFVSSFFLLLVLIVYSVLQELRNLSGQILMACVASLLTAIFLYAVLRLEERGIYVCYGMSLVIYFARLASFCWMNVMSYKIWRTFRGITKVRPTVRGEACKYRMYSLYAWGLPLAMTIMLFTVEQSDLRHKPWIVKPNLMKMGCFIDGGEKFYYLYCPMLILICANWMFFLMTAFNIRQLSRGTSVLDSSAAGTPAAPRSNQQRFPVYLKLTVVMGLNWLLEVFSFFLPNDSIWLVSDCCNILVGGSFFLVFVCKRKIFRKLAKVYLRCKNRFLHLSCGTQAATRERIPPPREAQAHLAALRREPCETVHRS